MSHSQRIYTSLDPAMQRNAPLLTPATVVEDAPTTFIFDGKEYAPNNYGQEYHGPVTLREALTYPLNVATVKVAEMVGYGRVAYLVTNVLEDVVNRGTGAAVRSRGFGAPAAGKTENLQAPSEAQPKRPGFFRRLFGRRKNSKKNSEKRSALFPLPSSIVRPKENYYEQIGFST